MITKATFALLAIAIGSAPLTAQLGSGDRSGDRSGARSPRAPRPADERVDGRVDGRADSRVGFPTGSQSQSRVPPGHLPPAGKCRVWIDGVPPGRQPAVTDCITAERTRVANSRVIYGDREAFRGRANGKFDKRGDARRADERCRLVDAVVVGGRVIDVCADQQSGRVRDRDDDDDDDLWDDDDDEDDRRKEASKAEQKRVKEAAKARRKGAKARGKG